MLFRSQHNSAVVSKETLFLRVTGSGATFLRVNCCPRSILSCQIFSDLYMGATSVCCVRASGFGPGLVFSDRSGDLSDPGLWARGLVRSVSGSSRVSGSGFAMSVCGFDGVERWRALLWRSFIGSDRQVFRARRQDQRKNIAVFANGMTLPRLARGEDRLRDSFKKLS